MHETILAEISYFLFELAETKYFGDFIFLVAMNCIWEPVIDFHLRD